MTTAKYRIRHNGPSGYRMYDPEGHWIGPGLGLFRSPAEAMDWLASYIERNNRPLA